MSSGPMVRLRTAGGGKITVDTSSGKVIGEDDSEVPRAVAAFRIDPTVKEGIFDFAIGFQKNLTPRSVKIEDVSGDQPQLIVDKLDPKLTVQIWRWTSAPMKPDDKALQWLNDIDDSCRVYRITIVLTDGRQIVRHAATIYPSYAKTGLRTDLGLETRPQ